MRKGSNPQKHKNLNINNYTHRIIIPVHIPTLSDYYENSLDILKICIESLLNTIHVNTAITIISNDCCSEILDYLSDLQQKKIIHSLILNSENSGKVDPVVSVMRGCLEELITITDCDVLFKNGWQFAVESIFHNIPYSGMVSPLPQPNLKYFYSTWSWFYGIIKYKIIRLSNRDNDSLIRFKESLGISSVFSEDEKFPFYIQKSNELIACLGCGHFCSTFKRSIIPFIPLKSSGHKFDNAEKYFLDKPIEDAGLMRLSTVLGYVYHMGNVPENWMLDELNKSKENKSINHNLGNSHNYNFNWLTQKSIFYLLQSSRIRLFINKYFVINKYKQRF